MFYNGSRLKEDRSLKFQTKQTKVFIFASVRRVYRYKVVYTKVAPVSLHQK